MAPRVSDRRSEAENIVGVELVIVGDEVVVNLWADEYVPPGVVADSNASMEEEMSAVQVGTAASGGERASSYAIEEQAHDTGSGHEVTVRFGCKPV